MKRPLTMLNEDIVETVDKINDANDSGDVVDSFE